MFTKIKNKWLILFALILLLPASVFAINKIYLSNIDGTLPTISPEPLPPIIGSLISTVAVTSSRPGSFWGINSSGFGTVKYSNDSGITWTATAVDPGNNFRGIEVVGSRILIPKQLTSSSAQCDIKYTDNLGASWTTVTLTGSNYHCGDFSQYDGLKCFGTTCYISAISGTPTGDVKIWKSTDSGLSWSNVYTTAGRVHADSVVGYYDGTNIIVLGDGTSTCTATNSGTIISSTDNGSTWNIWAAPISYCTTASELYLSVTKLGSTYYAVTHNTTTSVIYLVSSTDLINWTISTPIGLGTNGTAGSIFIAGYNNYNPDTMYLMTADESDFNVLKVYSTSNGSSFTMIYNTTIGDTPGNMMQSVNNLYFGSSNNRYFKLEP